MSHPNSWRRMLATVGGVGTAPRASGTFGAAVGALLFAPLLWQIATRGESDAFPLVLLSVALTGVVIAVSVAIGHHAERDFGSKDPGAFVLDEVAGQWTAMLFLPLAGVDGGWSLFRVVLLQFGLFRLFDIAKPPPVRQLERLPGGWGITLDDVAAGIMANVVGQVLLRSDVAGSLLSSVGSIAS